MSVYESAGFSALLPSLDIVSVLDFSTLMYGSEISLYLFYIFLLTNAVGHFFMYICVSSLGKFLLKSFPVYYFN